MARRKIRKVSARTEIGQLKHENGNLRLEIDDLFKQLSDMRERIRHEEGRSMDLRNQLTAAQENDQQSRGMTVQALGVLEKVVATFTDTQKTVNEALLRLVPKPVEHHTVAPITGTAAAPATGTEGKFPCD